MYIAALMLSGAMALAEPEKPSRLKRYLYYGSLHAADAWSTDYALARHRHESNPASFLQSSKGRWISKMGVGTVILAEADYYLSHKKHKKTKWVVRVVAGSALGWATWHNMGARNNPKEEK